VETSFTLAFRAALLAIFRLARSVRPLSSWLGHFLKAKRVQSLFAEQERISQANSCLRRLGDKHTSGMPKSRLARRPRKVNWLA
jgi:hypothetical protein